MGYLALGVTSTTAEGAARLIDGPKPPSLGLSLTFDPLIALAAATILAAIFVARWGGLFEPMRR